MKAILLLIAASSLAAFAQDNTNGTNSNNDGKKQTGIGDFIFDAPDPKAKSETLLFKAGGVMRLQWHTQPSSLADPATVTLSYRLGAWSDGNSFQDMAVNVPNENYYDWNIPENIQPGKYIVRINTTIKQPEIRPRTTQQFQVYIGKTFIDAGSAPSTRQVDLFSITMLSAASLIIIRQLFAF